MATAYAEGDRPVEETKVCPSAVFLARMILSKDKVKWLVDRHLPENYKELPKEQQEEAKDRAFVMAYNAWKRIREKCAEVAETCGEFSDDEESDDEEEKEGSKFKDPKFAAVDNQIAELGAVVKKNVLEQFRRRK